MRKGASPLLGSSGCPAEVEVLSKERLCGQRHFRALVLSLTQGRGQPGPRGVWCAKGGEQMETGGWGIRVGFSHRTGRVVGGRGGSWKVLGSQGEQLRAGRKDRKKGKSCVSVGTVGG